MLRQGFCESCLFCWCRLRDELFKMFPRRWKADHWVIYVPVLSTYTQHVVIVTSGSVCIPRLRETERRIRFDHLPSVEGGGGETCLSKGV